MQSLLTGNQISLALGINYHTLDVLVRNGIIPHQYIQGYEGKELRFNPYLVVKWLSTKPPLEIKNEKTMDDFRNYIEETFPETIKSIRIFNAQFSTKRKTKEFYLAKIPNKKYGFLYYVRYSENGKLIHSRWNTHTNNLNAAEQFAIDNREKILNEYHLRRQPENLKNNLYYVLKNYYKPNSVFFEEAKLRGRNISSKTLGVYDRWINNIFIPFLRKNSVLTFQDITPQLITKLQLSLLSGRMPQSIKQYISGVKTLFRHLVVNGIITDNVFDKVQPIRSAEKIIPRGCYEIDKINGVFNRKWHEERNYFLNLLIYTTNMRNNEIARIRLKDTIKIRDCRFINVLESKTENGVRIIPLHPFVYDKLVAYAKKHGLSEDDYLLSSKGRITSSWVFDKACTTLCEKLRKKLNITDVKEYLTKENITFYSGRHFWKTLMSANGLGDIEEYFMGHKISSDVSKRYNRKDKIGQSMLIKKAHEVFKILDKWVFKA